MKDTLDAAKELEKRRYIVRDRDGHYLRRTISIYDSTTCPIDFEWTKHRHLAARFTDLELNDKHATISLMQQILHGHAGAQQIRVL